MADFLSSLNLIANNPLGPQSASGFKQAGLSQGIWSQESANAQMEREGNAVSFPSKPLDTSVIQGVQFPLTGEMPMTEGERLKSMYTKIKVDKANRAEMDQLSGMADAFGIMSDWQPKINAKQEEVKALVQKYAGIAAPQLKKPEFSNEDIISLALGSLVAGKVQPQMVRAAYDNAVQEAMRNYQNETVANQAQKEALGMEINLSQSALADMQRIASQDKELGMRLWMYQTDMTRQGRLDEFNMHLAQIKSLNDTRQILNDSAEITPENARSYNQAVDEAAARGVPVWLLPPKLAAGRTLKGQALDSDEKRWGKEFGLKEKMFDTGVKQTKEEQAAAQKRFEAEQALRWYMARNDTANDKARLAIERSRLRIDELKAKYGTNAKGMRTDLMSDIGKADSALKGAISRSASYETKMKALRTQIDATADADAKNDLNKQYADLSKMKDENDAAQAENYALLENYYGEYLRSSDKPLQDWETLKTMLVEYGKTKPAGLQDAFKQYNVPKPLRDIVQYTIDSGG